MPNNDGQQGGWIGVAYVAAVYLYIGGRDKWVFDAYSQVIEAVAPVVRVYLYHIPQLSGVPITSGLIETEFRHYALSYA